MSALRAREGARRAFVELHAVTSIFFGAVQRRVRGVQHQLGRRMSLRSLRQADADADGDPWGTRLVRLRRGSRLACPIWTSQNKRRVRYGTTQRFHERLCLPRGAASKYDEEFLAAVAERARAATRSEEHTS